MYTPDKIENLQPNEIFVFGSNQMADHKGGAALIARENFGLLQGYGSIGLCGQSYGIITTSFNNTPIPISFIKEQINVLYGFATLRPDLTFYVTKIGTGIAGFAILDIRQLFLDAEHHRPHNIILPKEFHYKNY